MTWKAALEGGVIGAIVAFITQVLWTGVLIGALWIAISYLERVCEKNFPRP